MDTIDLEDVEAIMNEKRRGYSEKGYDQYE